MKRFLFAFALGLVAACSDSAPEPGADAGSPGGFDISSFEAPGDGAGTLEIEFQWTVDDPEGLVESCTLDPGDGTGAVEVDCAAGAASHGYGAAGGYTATLTAASTSDSASATAEVEVAPTADLSSWAQQFGSAAGPVWARGVDSDADGNSVVVGSVGRDAVVEGATSSAGQEDLFVAKFDPAGSTLWVQQVGSNDTDQAWAVDVDGDGNAYVAGWTEGDLAAPNAGNDDALLLALDPDGTLLWKVQLGSTSFDDAHGVVVHEASGAIYIAGQTTGAIPGATGTGSGFVARYGVTGSAPTLSWVTQFEAANDGLSHNWSGLAVDADGNAYVTGFVTFGYEVNDPSTQAILVEVSAAGAVTSRQTFGAEGAADHGNAVTVSTDGVYVGGSTRGSFGGEYENGWDSFVVAFGADGAQRWVTQHSGTFDDHVHGLDVDASGNVYAAGETFSAAGENRAVVTSYRPDGTERWSGEVDGRADAYDVAVSPDGTTVVCGDTGDDLDGESTAGGFVDAYVAAVAPAAQL